VGRNLTDATQRNAVALNKGEVILPGRRVRLLVRVGFCFRAFENGTPHSQGHLLG